MDHQRRQRTDQTRTNTHQSHNRKPEETTFSNLDISAMAHSISHPDQITRRSALLLSRVHGNWFVTRLVQRLPRGTLAPANLANQIIATLLDRRIEVIETYLKADEEKDALELESKIKQLKILDKARILHWRNRMNELDPVEQSEEYKAARGKLKQAISAKYRHTTRIALLELSATDNIEDEKEREKARLAAAEKLVTVIRELLETSPSYSEMIDTFVMQQIPPPAEKTATIGKAVVALARMEFLLGTILHKGDKWETGGDSNTGFMITEYKKSKENSVNWCASFANYTRRKLTGLLDKDIKSGYQVVGKLDGGEEGADDDYYNYDFDPALGGGHRWQTEEKRLFSPEMV